MNNTAKVIGIFDVKNRKDVNIFMSNHPYSVIINRLALLTQNHMSESIEKNLPIDINQVEFVEQIIKTTSVKYSQTISQIEIDILDDMSQIKKRINTQ